MRLTEDVEKEQCESLVDMLIQACECLVGMCIDSCEHIVDMLVPKRECECPVHISTK